jgi:hypothetical protein
MKKIAFLSIVTLLSLSSCILDGWDQSLSGKGKVVEEIRDLDGFTGVKVNSGIDVYLSQGSTFEVKVVADENLHEVILTELEGKMLIVKTERVNIRSAKSKKVYVTLPELTELKISSAGDIVGQTQFSCEDLRISVSSAGDLSIEVKAKQIDLDISSSGDVDIAGIVDELNVNLSSAGDLNAFDLIAGKVDVDVSSAGDARVYATEEISMNVSSAGNVSYMRDARVVHSQSSSAGKISHRD